MDQTLFVLPILPGKTEAARAFLQELGGARKQELAACGQRVGIPKEMWALQRLPQGDVLISYMAGDDLAHAFTQFAASQDDFDRWMKRQLQEVTGADLNTPPSGPLSECLVRHPGLTRRVGARCEGAVRADPTWGENSIRRLHLALWFAGCQDLGADGVFAHYSVARLDIAPDGGFPPSFVRSQLAGSPDAPVPRIRIEWCQPRRACAKRAARTVYSGSPPGPGVVGIAVSPAGARAMIGQAISGASLVDQRKAMANMGDAARLFAGPGSHHTEAGQDQFIDVGPPGLAIKGESGLYPAPRRPDRHAASRRERRPLLPARRRHRRGTRPVAVAAIHRHRRGDALRVQGRDAREDPQQRRAGGRRHGERGARRSGQARGRSLPGALTAAVRAESSRQDRARHAPRVRLERCGRSRCARGADGS